MKAEFKIYKEGVTNGVVTIFSKEGEVFNRELKIIKYKYLGYMVYSMKGEEI